MTDTTESFLMILPPVLAHKIKAIPPETRANMEEIRIREHRPLEVVVQGSYRFVTPEGMLTTDTSLAFRPSRMDCVQLLDLLTNHSVYSFEEELKRGYITVKGGHRVGLAGKAVLEQGAVRQLREISSFNIRIAREILDAAKPLLPFLRDDSSGSVYHTLVVSPPQQGKTTLIRDLARLLGGHFKIGIVDERSEIAALIKGVPSFDIGPRTDVLDGCPKAEGMMMMIRAMSPDVLIVDEIGRMEDAEAIHEALLAGIRVIATAHGHSFEEVHARPMLRQLMQEQIFQRYVILGHTYGMGRIHRIYDAEGRLLESLILRRSTHA